MNKKNFIFWLLLCGYLKGVEVPHFSSDQFKATTACALCIAASARSIQLGLVDKCISGTYDMKKMAAWVVVAHCAEKSMTARLKPLTCEQADTAVKVGVSLGAILFAGLVYSENS